MGELKKPTIKNFLISLIFIFVFLLLIWIIANQLPPAIDWQDVFYKAGRTVLKGQSPFSVPGFYYAPWTALLLMPFALFPPEISQAIMVFSTLISIGFISYKLGAKPLATIFILISPPVVHSVLNGNIDWLSLLGILMPPQIGLFFLVIKPQVGIMVAVFWFFEAWRKGRLKEVIKIFWPITLALLFSFLFFGLWPLNYQDPIKFWWNASLWPYSIPIGLLLIYLSIRKKKIEYSLAASPFLSPYVLLHSWISPILALSASTPRIIAVVVGLWILVLFRL